MKKLLLLLLVLSTPIFAQTEGTSQKKEMSPFLKKMIGRYGYNTLEEFHQNTYAIVSLGSSSVISSPYYMTGVSLDFGGLMHRKDKLYGVYLVNLDLLFGNTDSISYEIGYQMGVGLSFYDNRDYKGSGWLAGVNAEFGVGYLNSRHGSGGSYTAGVNIRGLYRNNYGIGMSLSLLLAYNFSNFYNARGVHIGSHGFEIKPSIGFAY